MLDKETHIFHLELHAHVGLNVQSLREGFGLGKCHGKGHLKRAALLSLWGSVFHKESEGSFIVTH